MKTIEIGTHRTVYMVDGQRQVVRHNPPRDYRDVLTDIGVRMGLDDGFGTGQQIPEPFPLFDDERELEGLQRNSQPRKARMLDATEAANVLADPLLRLPGTESDRTGGIRLRQGEADPETANPSLGQYRDFREKPRSLPQLHGLTIKGILVQPGALGTDTAPTEEHLKDVAKKASKYRRDNGVGGGDCGPEAVELYIRVFRALGMQPNDATTRGADELRQLYLAYLRVHAG